MKKLFNLIKYPEPFSPGTDDIWQDSNRKKLVLETHFNDDIPGGSKKTEFINNSVKFISDLSKNKDITSILDLACGPGRYSNALSQLNFIVTGVDYNSEALALASNNSKDQSNPPNYFCDDLRTFSIPNKHDLCLLIYHVYGSFSYQDRKKIVENIYEHLNPGGYILLDVLSEVSYIAYSPNFTWFYSDNDIFSKDKYISLVSNLKYPDKITVDRNIVLFQDDTIVNYNYWNQYFNLKDIETEFESFGFTIETVYGDVDGRPYDSDDKQFALLLKKV